jgi:hypothetical protein
MPIPSQQLSRNRKRTIMARGLSNLQKTILIAAYQRYPQVLLRRDVLIHYYGFKPTRNLLKLDSYNARNGVHIFDVKAEGTKRYRSRNVAVTRSFKRLVNRGLAKYSHCRGLFLTCRGSEVVNGLLDKL